MAAASKWQLNQQERIKNRNQIELSLQNSLNNTIEKIKANNIKDTGLAQRYFGNEVNQIMRAYAEQAYYLGVQYVADKKNQLGFLTTFDTETIKAQVDKYSVSFWIAVNNVLHRNDVLLQKHNYEPRSELNSNYLATRTAIALVTTTMALATKTKVLVFQGRIKSAAITHKCKKGQHWDNKLKKCVDDDIAPPSQLPIPPSEPDDGISDMIPLLLALGSYAAGDNEYNNPEEPQGRNVLIWNAILDQNTCQVCADLDGTVWTPDNPNLPTPGDEGDIHYNCRCFWDTETMYEQ